MALDTPINRAALATVFPDLANVSNQNGISLSVISIHFICLIPEKEPPLQIIK